MNGNVPFFTIAIPVFNRLDYFKEALNSVLSQSFNDFEIVIIDDCSTDGTWEYIKAVKDKRVRIFRNSENIGIVPNWNRCISEARGKWFKFLMSDDLFFPDSLYILNSLIIKYPENFIVVTSGITFKDINSVKNLLNDTKNRLVSDTDKYLYPVKEIIKKRKRFIQSWSNPDSYTLLAKDLKALVDSDEYREVVKNLGNTGHCVDYYILHSILKKYKTMIEIDLPTYAVRDHSSNFSKTYLSNLLYHLKGDKYVHYLLYNYRGFENFYIIKHAFNIYFNKLVSNRKSLSFSFFIKMTVQLFKFLFMHVFSIKIKF